MGRWVALRRNNSRRGNERVRSRPEDGNIGSRSLVLPAQLRIVRRRTVNVYDRKGVEWETVKTLYLVQAEEMPPIPDGLESP